MKLESLARDIAKIRRNTVQGVLDECDLRYPDGVHEVIGDVLFHERRGNGGTARDGGDEEDAFYRDVARRAAGASAGVQRRVLVRLADHYLDQIIGDFDPWVYRVATRVLPAGLSLLAGGVFSMSLSRWREASARLDSTIRIRGDLETLKMLKDSGSTLVYAPTHTSNLDSAILAYALYRAGLPAALYGAGRTVFDLPVFGAFMNRLGAYRIDLARRSVLYRCTVRHFAASTLVEGYDNMFFPAGYRTRSGAVESDLGTGLLGSALAASQRNLESNEARPWVYVVPVALSYELVIEAGAMIADHLSTTGGSKVIIPDDDTSSPVRVLDYIERMFERREPITVRFMPPLDPFGHEVDAQGLTYGPGSGEALDPTGYLKRDGVLVSDRQRDLVFTGKLGAEICSRMHSGTELYATHVVARAAFGSMRGAHRSADLYSFLAREGRGAGVSRRALRREVSRVRDAVLGMEAGGSVHLSREVGEGTPEDLIRSALESFAVEGGVPALQERGDRVYSMNPNLLMYYHNRLDGFGLADRVEDSK